MNKESLIKKLQSIEGNPIILLNDSELGFVELRDAELCEVHQSKDEPDMYINDFDFKNELDRNTYYHDNYKSEMIECVLLSI